MENRWQIFPRLTTFGFLEQIQEFMKEQNCDPEQFKGRIIFMSMFNDIVWPQKGNEEQCKSNAHEVADYPRRFLRGHWSFLGPGSDKKWYGTYSDKPDGVWDKNCVRHDAWTRRNHSFNVPCFQRPWKSGITKQRPFISTVVSEQKTLKWSCAPSCLRISSLSSEQLQIDAQRYPRIPWLQGNQKHMQETIEIPTLPPTADPRTDEQRRWNLLQEYEQQFEQLSDARKLSKLCSKPGLKTVERQQNFITLDTEGPSGMVHLCREWRCLVTNRDFEQEAVFVRRRQLAQSWTFTFVTVKIVTVLSDLCFKTEPPLGFELWMELKGT